VGSKDTGEGMDRKNGNNKKEARDDLGVVEQIGKVIGGDKTIWYVLEMRYKMIG